LLRIVEERSVKETAQLLGISAAAVKSRIFQGRRKLRRHVNLRCCGGVFPALPGKGAVRRSVVSLL
jgi:Sigma-70, region 4